mmetsp:Transcript_50038/g.74702  ORF Transcript_50038/g.74702 Transcript_50038/m.74702 type:complete len:110 (+) Transcript_50038:1093-1422(+)
MSNRVCYLERLGGSSSGGSILTETLSETRIDLALLAMLIRDGDGGGRLLTKADPWRALACNNDPGMEPWMDPEPGLDIVIERVAIASSIGAELSKKAPSSSASRLKLSV